MRRCDMCKVEEGKNHVQQCSYYWGLVASGPSTEVAGETCIIEDTDGCPLSELSATMDCPGCVECL